MATSHLDREHVASWSRRGDQRLAKSRRFVSHNGWHIIQCHAGLHQGTDTVQVIHFQLLIFRVEEDSTLVLHRAFSY